MRPKACFHRLTSIFGLASPTNTVAPHDRNSSSISLDGVSVTSGDSILLAQTFASIQPGQMVVVRGNNGAGKTTLLSVIAGRVKPSAGAVTVGGYLVDDRDPGFRRQVASLIGLPPFATDLTVSDHVALVSATWAASSELAQRSTRRVLTELQLNQLSSRYPHELSTGQMQLLALALVLVRPADVLLLDEPEQRLDPDRIELLAQALIARHNLGVTVVVATHSDQLADRVQGRTIQLQAAA